MQIFNILQYYNIVNRWTDCLAQGSISNQPNEEFL